MEEKKELNQDLNQDLTKTYGNEKEVKYAQKYIQQINDDLELREKASMVHNGISYSQAYAYNQRKAVNYSPPKSKKDDREITMGIVHEKIVSFISIFLKYIFKRQIKCYDENGALIRRMGKIYELAIEFSYQLEELTNKIALIYWEVFSQGNAFVLEDWEVKNINMPKSYKGKGKDKVLVTPDGMDYTYEFLDGLTHEAGKDVQTRRAVSRVLDGRMVIFGNPEIEEIQEQPRITIEEEITRADAEAIFGSLKRWESIPKEKEDIATMVGEKTTLFDSARHKDPKDIFIMHKAFDKGNNRFNIFLNGVMMLPRETPMSLFYPRMNYPLSNVAAERLRGSIYARSIPAKTKFNADFLDWAFKMLANKFEQGIDPAILAKGKWTITRDIFRGGNVSHGVSRDDYEKADPDNKGVTAPEFNFASMLKEIIESQTVNPTTAGEATSTDTLGQEQMLERNQLQKMGFILDGITNGWVEMVKRRAETIESKYTIKQRETMVDGKKVSVYQNFTVSVAGVENVVEFNDEVGGENYDEEGKKNELFTKAFQEKKKGFQTEYYLANPQEMRENRYNLIVEIMPERIKDTRIKLLEMWEDFTNRLNMFGQSNNIDEMKKEYLETSGKPDAVFTSKVYERLEEEAGARGGESQKRSTVSDNKQQANLPK